MLCEMHILQKHTYSPGLSAARNRRLPYLKGPENYAVYAFVS
jgi:hypothetical protein